MVVSFELSMSMLLTFTTKYLTYFTVFLSVPSFFCDRINCTAITIYQAIAKIIAEQKCVATEPINLTNLSHLLSLTV